MNLKPSVWWRNANSDRCHPIVKFFSSGRSIDPTRTYFSIINQSKVESADFKRHLCDEIKKVNAKNRLDYSHPLLFQSDRVTKIKIRPSRFFLPATTLHQSEQNVLLSHCIGSVLNNWSGHCTILGKYTCWKTALYIMASKKFFSVTFKVCIYSFLWLWGL